MKVRSSKPKAKEDVEISDIKILKMLKALDNPIRLEIVNLILSKRTEENENSS